MNFDEYVASERTRYALLATVVESILMAALQHRPDIRLQQTQRRAKNPSSLSRKLKRDGFFDARDIENRAKDLAGCRLIFYTNSDASKFLNSGIISDNFDVDWDRSRIHHPTSHSAPASEQFVSNNYVVRLKENRADLPEYSAVAGLWCEVQIQTTLNHAWAELAHDTIYKKPDLPGGFGKSLMRSIEDRMRTIMRKYILPAGHDFEKVLSDFERLSAGRDLFDKGLLPTIEECEDNNARFEVLERFSTYVLPYYDDIGAAYADVMVGMRKVIRAARTSTDVPVETIFGSYPGHTQQQVISKAADIVDRLRYVDIDRTFDFLVDAFGSAANDEERNRWKNSGEELCKHDLSVWERAGPTVQLRIIDRIKRLKKSEKQAVRGLLIAMLRKMLETEITGTTAHFQTITLHRGGIPLNLSVIQMRRDALRLLKLLFLRGATDEERRQALSALHGGTRLIGDESAEEAARVAVLRQSKEIVEFYRRNSGRMGNELLAKMEHKALWLYRHTPDCGDGDELSPVQRAQLELRREILAFRDEINTNERYVVFKSLVGYDSVFAPSWKSDEFDISELDEYRSKRIDEFIEDISNANLDYWKEVVHECASVQSSDLATFPKFSEFLEKLARQKPSLAAALFEADEGLLSKFLPSLLRGWEESEDGPDVIQLRRKWVSEGKFLSAVIWSFRFGGKLDPVVLKKALKKAASADDRLALWNLVTIADLRNEDAKGGLVDSLLIPSIQALSALGEHSWPRAAWGRRGSTFKKLNEIQAAAILDALVPAPKLDWDDEEILAAVAETHPRLVVDFFSSRLAHNQEKGARYEPIPFEFSRLNVILVESSAYVIDAARRWYSLKPRLFMFSGGRFVANVFKDEWTRLEAELRRFITDGQEDVDFVLQVLRAYEGEEFLHPLIKDIVARLTVESEALNEVAIVLEESGVVAGEFGFVELHQQRRDLMTKWLDDPREPVVDFAKKQIRALENRIAAEQRRAEADYELRKRDWGGEDEPSE